MSTEAIISPKAVPITTLTKYPQGSLRELWVISFPLMLSLLSSSLMLFFDRLLLSKSSLDCLNACTNAGVIAASFQFLFISTTSIAEVFVGQYNGAGLKNKIGEPVWQMIWLSLLTAFISLPIGFLAAPLIFVDSDYSQLELQYFQWIMYFTPFFCLSTALSTFYIGRAYVHFVTMTVIAANVINVLLDLILIFGWEPWVPSYGISGAAIATGISQVFQCLVLFIGFFNKKNRDEFGTGNMKLKLIPFMNCLKIGMPNAISHSIEIGAWAIFFRMMTNLGHEYITVIAVAQSIFILFTFITDGMSKGTSAIAANMIGANKYDIIWKLLGSGVKFYFFASLILSTILVIYPDPLIHWFIPAGDDVDMIHQVRSACFWVWVFFFFDGITWLIVGVLTAAGDTRFVMKAGVISVWIFALAPIYIFLVKLGYKADVAWAITAVYGAINCVIYLSRLLSGKWKRSTLLAINEKDKFY